MICLRPTTIRKFTKFLLGGITKLPTGLRIIYTRGNENYLRRRDFVFFFGFYSRVVAIFRGHFLKIWKRIPKDSQVFFEKLTLVEISISWAKGWEFYCTFIIFSCWFFFVLIEIFLILSQAELFISRTALNIFYPVVLKVLLAKNKKISRYLEDFFSSKKTPV